MNGFWIMLGLFGLAYSIEVAAKTIAGIWRKGITITQNVTHIHKQEEAP